MFQKKAFTLVELMIVIAIIGILAVALFPSMTSYLARGRNTARIGYAQDYIRGIELYVADRGIFPDNIYSGSDCGGWDSDRDGTFLTALKSGGYIKSDIPQISYERKIDAMSSTGGLRYTCIFGNFSYHNYGTNRNGNTPGSSTNSNILCPGEKGSAYIFGIHMEGFEFVHPQSPGFQCGSEYFISPLSRDGGLSSGGNYFVGGLHVGNYSMGRTMSP